MIDDKVNFIANKIREANEIKLKAEKLLSEAIKEKEEAHLFVKKLISDSQNEISNMISSAKKEIEDEFNKNLSIAKNNIEDSEKMAVIRIKEDIISSIIQKVENFVANNNDSIDVTTQKSIEKIIS
jgi:F0F1-type ATP synthase membrane subunit b/b'